MVKTEDVGIRRREVSDAVRIAREASLLVRPFNEKIGPLQAESIRLGASAQRMRQSGRHDPGLVEAIRVLMELVEDQRRQFEAIVSAAEASVAAHGRIGDTRQALGMVADRLRASL